MPKNALTRIKIKNQQSSHSI